MPAVAARPRAAADEACPPASCTNSEQEEEEPLPSDLSWTSYVFAVWNLIIRPPRKRYSSHEATRVFPVGRWRLGCQQPLQGQVVGERSDFELVNQRGHKLLCSLFEPDFGPPSTKERACVVCCHGNGGNRCLNC
eukprot:TRINITY_DN30971_c0_g1_i1.p1 TRINITY_DN30971_c0_g1~~TRINITY_DN30971_c0_g1_i1.p1  ORF type:complete len:135 (+),score=20.52 TRINITY_DN30971_c0_g1_i1:83-487(+)